MLRATSLCRQPYEHALKNLNRFRSNISALRRSRPHVPFWKLSAHRIPTLWSLYRGLLRNSPNEDIKWRIGKVFRRHRHITSPQQAKEKLEQYHSWLSLFKQAQAGDRHLEAVLQRYGKMIAERREKEKFKAMLIAEAKWQDRLRNRPIVTGSYFRPSLFNPPLPRLKPQPVPLSMMIRNRRRARARRIDTTSSINGHLDDLRYEALFEDSLAKASPGDKFQRVFGGINAPQWRTHLVQQASQINQSFQRDDQRAKMPFPPALLEQIREARRERDRNIAREREREKRGEVLKATKIRRKLGYPAPLMQKWSTKKRRQMLIVRRSISRVGYVGQLKRKMGWKIGKQEDIYTGRKLSEVQSLERHLEKKQQNRRDEEVIQA